MQEQHIEEEEEEEKEDEDEEDEQQISWSWRKLFKSVFGNENEKTDIKDTTDSPPDSYNLYDRKPDFRNTYGWSSALDGSDYPPLKIPDIGVFHVNLTAVFQTCP